MKLQKIENAYKNEQKFLLSGTADYPLHCLKPSLPFPPLMFSYKK